MRTLERGLYRTEKRMLVKCIPGHDPDYVAKDDAECLALDTLYFMGLVNREEAEDDMFAYTITSFGAEELERYVDVEDGS